MTLTEIETEKLIALKDVKPGDYIAFRGNPDRFPNDPWRIGLVTVTGEDPWPHTIVCYIGQNDTEGQYTQDNLTKTNYICRKATPAEALALRLRLGGCHFFMDQ